MSTEEKHDIYQLMCDVFGKTFPRSKSNNPKDILDTIGGILAMEKLLQRDDKTVHMKVTTILTSLCGFPNISMLVLKSKPLRRHLVLICDNLGMDDRDQLISAINALGNMCRLQWKPKYLEKFHKLGLWKKILNILEFYNLSEVPDLQLRESLFAILIIPALFAHDGMSPDEKKQHFRVVDAVLEDLCDKRVFIFMSNYLLSKPVRAGTGMWMLRMILIQHGDTNIVSDIRIFSVLLKTITSSPKKTAIEETFLQMFTGGSTDNPPVIMELVTSFRLLSCDTNGCNFRGMKNKFKVCGGCRSSRYCSRTCQKKDWKAHRKLCKKLSRNSGK